MKSSLITLFITTSILWLGCTSCSARTEDDGLTSKPENILRLGPFTEGNVIADVKPLRPEHTRDLREVALSLPIWESDSEAAMEWVYKYSEDGIHVDEWTNPADGAQHAVTLKRLEDSAQGQLRVEVHHPSLKIYTPSGGIYYPWVAILERREGGWLVESAKKKEG